MGARRVGTLSRGAHLPLHSGCAHTSQSQRHASLAHRPPQPSGGQASRLVVGSGESTRAGEADRLVVAMLVVAAPPLQNISRGSGLGGARGPTPGTGAACRLSRKHGLGGTGFVELLVCPRSACSLTETPNLCVVLSEIMTMAEQQLETHEPLGSAMYLSDDTDGRQKHTSKPCMCNLFLDIPADVAIVRPLSARLTRRGLASAADKATFSMAYRQAASRASSAGEAWANYSGFLYTLAQRRIPSSHAQL